MNGSTPRKAARGFAREVAEWAVSLLFLLFATTTVAQPFVVPTGSMESTVLIGDHMLVDKLTYSVLAGRKDMHDGLFAALAQIEPETLAMMFLDPRFYQRSVSFWPPHVRQAQAAGEISAAANVDLVTDLIVRLAVSLVMFPRIGVELNTRRALRAYLQRALGRELS